MDSEMEIDYAAELSDEISLASSDDDQGEREYEVETILADRHEAGGWKYLVKWSGYHTLKATWEPPKNFNNRLTLREWRKRKAEVEAGRRAPFDVDRFQKNREKAKARHEAHELERTAQAEEKRLRLEKLLFQEDLNIDPESEGPEPEGDLVESAADTTIPPASEPESTLPGKISPLFVSVEASPTITAPTPIPLDLTSTQSIPNAPPSPTPQSTHPPLVPQDSESAHQPQPAQKKAIQSNPSATTSAVTIFTANQLARRKSTWDVRLRDNVPDASGLELRKPSEFPARLGDSHAMTTQSTVKSPSASNNDGPPSTVTSQGPEPPHLTAPQVMAPPIRSLKTGEQNRTRSPGPYSRREPVDDRRPGPDRWRRSPGPYSRRESSPRPDDGKRPGADRRARSPDPYGRRESTSRADEHNQRDTSRQANVSRSRGYNRKSDFYRPPSPGSTSPACDSAPPLNSDSYRPGQIPPGSVSKHASTNPSDQRTPLPSNPATSPGHAKTTTMADQIARMPLGKIAPGGVRTTNGYFWNPGEVLAHVFLGHEKAIGAVRLCGMTWQAKKDLLASKPKPSRNFEMAFKVCSGDDYGYLCEQGAKEGMKNFMVCNAWMEGFQDTNGSLFHMAEYLRENNLLAVYSPSEKRGYAWLAYSSQSSDFEFLNSAHISVPDGVPLRLAVRSPLIGLEALDARLRPFPSQTLTSIADPRLRRQTSVGAELQQPREQGLFTNQIHQQSVNSRRLVTTKTPVLGNDFLADIQEDSGSMDLPTDMLPAIADPISQPQNPAHSPNELEPSMSDDADALRLIFEKNLHMSVEELATLPPSRENPEPIVADMFYLHFPEDQSGNAELQLLEKWLKLYDKKTWSNANPEGWSRFHHNCRCGVVIFHESKLSDILELRPAVNKRLWSSKMNFWVMRIATSLEFPDIRFCNEKAHFQPIFPRGGAFLMTEDVFQDLRSAAVLICWFHTLQNKYPGQYKLVLFPDVMTFLDRKLDDLTLSPDDMKLLIAIVTWIMRANSVDRNNPDFRSTSLDIHHLDQPNNNVVTLNGLPGYGSRRENENPSIPKGLTQAERNADHLVETFAGWTLLHSTMFRKSLVITTMANDKLWERWKTWGHIYPCTISQFFKFNGISEEQMLERLHEPDAPAPPNSGGPSSPMPPPKAIRPPHHHGLHSAPQYPTVNLSPRETYPPATDEITAGQDQMWRTPSHQPNSPAERPNPALPRR